MHLFESEVANCGANHSTSAPDQIGNRRPANTRQRHGLLGCGPARLWGEGDAEGSEGLSGYVSGRRRRLATAEVHHRPLRAHHVAYGAGSCTRLFAARLDGRDPAEEKKQSRRRLVVDRIDDLVETFIRERVSQIRTSNKISNLLRRDVLPHWTSKSIHEIKKRDVLDLISEVSHRGTHAGHRLLKTLKTFFRWCVGRAVIDFSPAEGVPSNWRGTSRDRVLADPSWRSLLPAVRAMPAPFGGIVEFLALTGQRREEVAQLPWVELDEQSRTWHIPATRTKNGKAHIVHLSEQAWAVIDRHPRTSDLVFATSGASHFQAFGKLKRELDELSGVRDWWLHDLRRTIVSGMARMGVPPHVADKILNHQSGTISGVAAVYQRHEFLNERKNALDQWGAHVAKVVDAGQQRDSGLDSAA